MMQFLVYAVLSVNSSSGHGEGERAVLTLCCQVVLELGTRKREMRRNWGHHHVKLELRRIFCARQLAVPNTADTCPNPAGNKITIRSS
jgi:hypothetical protein